MFSFIKTKYKTYIRFNKEEKVFEEIALSREHQERSELFRKQYKERSGVEVMQGDLVRVKDGSGNLDLETAKKRHGIHPLFQENLALVIETDLQFITEPLTGLGEDSRYVLDLLLLFPDGERVYTSHRFVQLIKDGEWKYRGTTWPKWEKIR
jgi:hypothetical protein